MTQTVFYNADVYSSADPFATAISVQADSVTWVGGDEAAQTMSGDLVDAEEDFITPGLATAALELGPGSPDPSALVAAGILHAHVIGTRAALDAFVADAGVLRVTAYELGTAPREGRRPALEAAVLAESTGEAVAGTGTYVQVRDAHGLRAVLELLADDARRTAVQRAGWRLRIATDLDDQTVAALGASGLGVTIDPLARDFPVAALLAAGVQLSFELDPAQPWETMRAAVFGSDGTTGRAAFNCATRFTHRAAGDSSGGVLAPGSAAQLVRWHVGTLVVQAADARVAAWSTDPRSGTPGLPDLTPGRALPQPVEVYVDGVRLPE